MDPEIIIWKEVICTQKECTQKEENSHVLPSLWISVYNVRVSVTD